MKEKVFEPKPQVLKGILTRLPSLKGKKIIVVGDSGLDEYVFGKVRRISPEAPVPVVEVPSEENIEHRLGLSTNVAQNIVSLGGEVSLVSVIGKDECANQLKKILEQSKIPTKFLVEDRSRPTTRKLRVMAGQHHIVRVDYEQQKFLSLDVQEKILEQVKSQIKNVDGVIVQDYAKGVISESLVQEIVGLAKSNGKKVFADPHKSTPTKYYRGVDVMTPNYDEAVALSGLNLDDLRTDDQSLYRISETIRATIQAPQLVITRSKEGMSVFENDSTIHIPTFAKQVFDVTGAGDTVIATLALSWVSGFSLEEACVIANHAAGVVVGKIGCVPCYYSELEAAIQSHV